MNRKALTEIDNPSPPNHLKFKTYRQVYLFSGYRPKEGLLRFWRLYIIPPPTSDEHPDKAFAARMTAAAPAKIFLLLFFMLFSFDGFYHINRRFSSYLPKTALDQTKQMRRSSFVKFIRMVRMLRLAQRTARECIKTYMTEPSASKRKADAPL